MDEPLVYALEGVEPDIDSQAFLAPTAVVVGRVRLAAGANVWFNSVIRGDSESITLGRDVNVQDGCVLHADPGFPLVLEDRVSLGHAAVVHGAHIGEGTLVGMGATVLNGARVGASCLVAAGAVVRPGAQIPEGSLVTGVPARVRRALTDDERASIERTPENYRTRSDLYRRHLVRIERQRSGAR